MFQKGDYIIYKRDLCQIREIEENPTTKEQYYNLSPVIDNTLRIKVPTTNKLNNLRYPITKEEIQKLIEKIPSIQPLNLKEKILENEYRQLLKSNAIEDLIKIIKTTYLRNQSRKISGKRESDKDLDYFHQAEKYLYTELAHTLEKDYEECKNDIIQEVEKNISTSK